MTELVLARTLHVVAVVLWIGGVAFVTTVLLPSVQRMTEPAKRVAFFEQIEGRFALQARITTLLAGASGFYLLHRLGAWSWFREPRRGYLHLMVLVWLLFTLMLFALEPLFLHRWFLRRAEQDPVGTFRMVRRLHNVSLVVSLLATAGAVAGSHGAFVLLP